MIDVHKDNSDSFILDCLNQLILIDSDQWNDMQIRLYGDLNQMIKADPKRLLGILDAYIRRHGTLNLKFLIDNFISDLVDFHGDVCLFNLMDELNLNASSELRKTLSD